MEVKIKTLPALFKHRQRQKPILAEGVRQAYTWGLAAQGSAYGSFLEPWGTFGGGILGGTAGYFIGNAVGDTIDDNNKEIKK